MKIGQHAGGNNIQFFKKNNLNQMYLNLTSLWFIEMSGFILFNLLFGVPVNNSLAILGQFPAFLC